MLITCNGCNSKIRVPDTAAGKRVKCPKCATLIKVPEAEKTPDVEPTAVSSAPMPPPAEPQEPADPEAFSTTPTSSGAKPPPLKKTRASSIDDDDKPQPPGTRRRKYDDDDDEEDGHDDFDVRNRGRANAPQRVNSMAMTSMIMGIVSLVSVWGSCCCGLFAVIALGCAVMAIIFGFLGKTPGSTGYAWAGIICGSVTLVLAAVGMVIIIFAVGMDVAMNQNFPQGGRRRFR